MWPRDVAEARLLIQPGFEIDVAFAFCPLALPDQLEAFCYGLRPSLTSIPDCFYLATANIQVQCACF